MSADSMETDVPCLKDADSWDSLPMPRRHVEESEIANDGMV